MNDPYPHDIEIEIDRAGMCRYLRLHAILVWSLVLGGPGSFYGWALATGRDNRLNINSVADYVQWFFRVTGGFLVRRDRKLHFRAIVDYTCYQGPLMRYCGITGIAMTTTAGGQGALLNVLAVKDAPKIRDLLSEIDRLREDEKPV